MRGVDLEVNGAPIDSLVAASNPRGFGLNLPTNLGEVIKSPSKLMQELSELLLRRFSIRTRPIGVVLVIFRVRGNVNQLQDKRTASNDSRTAWKEVASDNVLEY